MRTLIRLSILPMLALASALLAPAPTHAGNQIPEPVEKIAYRCSPGPGFDICTVNPDGTGWQQLTNDAKADYAPAISPNGQKIVWERDSVDLFIMNSDGTGMVEILGEMNNNFDSPSWSPDGSKIAFICNLPANANVNAICQVNANGSGFEVLFQGMEPRPTHLEWSPDPRYLLLEAAPVTNNEDIYTFDLQTDTMTNITDSDGEWEHGTWSPDGTKIAFVGTPFPGEPVSLAGLYVMNPDGTGRERLYTSPQSATATSPTWSPDGELIAYFCNFVEVCIVDAQSGNLVDTLTEDFVDKYSLGNDPHWAFTGGVLSGDIDCTDGLSPVDALKIIRFDAGLPAATACAPLGEEVTVAGVTVIWGDIDCSGTVDPVDALKLIRFDAGLPVTQGQDCPPLGTLLA